jgi:hypothetical protein
MVFNPRTIAALLLALAAAGCAQSWFPIFEARLNPLKGQPVQALIDRIGPADEQTSINDRKVYFWYGYDKAHPWRFSECTIQATVDKSERITDLFYSGNGSGCGRYAQELEKRT